MPPTVTQAISAFFKSHRDTHNAPELPDRWHPGMEVQILVAADGGDPVEGKHGTYTDGIREWWPIRIPKHANSEPEWRDYQINWSLSDHAEAIGMTGWDWVNRCSRWVGFDFDSITGHAAGVGITDEQLEAVKAAAMAVPYVEVRKSTSGGGVHLYAYCEEGIKTENHTIHQALGEAVLGMLSAATGFDFAADVDACGGVMWVWHRKMSAANGGLSLIKPSERVLTADELPADWRPAPKTETPGFTSVELDDEHRRIASALTPCEWDPEHKCYKAHTLAMKRVHDELKLPGTFETCSSGSTPINCFLYPKPAGAFFAVRYGHNVKEHSSWRTSAAGWTTCTYNRTNLPTIFENDGRTDAANAKRFAASHGESIRYCDLQHKWYIYDGQRWREDDQRRIEALAKEYADSLWATYYAAQRNDKPAYSFIKLTNNAAGIGNTVALARSEPGIPIRPNQLDTDHYLLNVANGTIDLRTGKLQAHDRNDYITKLCPVEYDPETKCPTWLAFLDKVFTGDKELISWVQRLLGHCLTGDISEHLLAICWGNGSNGKSTLCKVLLDVFGDYGYSSPPTLLVSHRNQQHPADKASLFGRRLAIASETEQGGQINEAQVKNLTGGDKISCRGMHENWWDFWPTHKFILCTNYQPQIQGTTDGIWRRLKLVPFVQKFWKKDLGETGPADLQANTKLGDHLKDEHSGILAWMVRGCLDWQRDGLGEPPAVRTATQGYRDSQDTFGEFIRACCEQKPDAEVGAAALLTAYQDHTGEDLGTKRFAALLRGHGFQPFRITSGDLKGKKAWRGLQLLA